jgi:hypothetical protein
MDSADLRRVERRARRAYEWSRVRRAAFGFAPVLVLVTAAVCLVEQRGQTLAFGSALFLLGVVVLWYGRDLKRAVLPGLAAGLIPLVAAICAHGVGHPCTGDCCTALCLPACQGGGLAAGLVVAWVGLRRSRGVWFWFTASGISLLTGAMGCVCVGYAGLTGLGLGYAIGVVPGFLAALIRRGRRGEG